MSKVLIVEDDAFLSKMYAKKFQVAGFEVEVAHDGVEGLSRAKSFAPDFHKKMSLSADELKKYGCNVGFIGQFEKERFQSMLFLAKNGVKVTVRGTSWEKYINIHPNMVVKPGFILGEEYAKVINATKINLCFLRKVNRDLQTARSIEIPACGAFMLGERTNEHLYLFKEGEEAEFFETDQELLHKIRFYLGNEEKRLQIAERGKRRCFESGYSTKERLFVVMKNIYAVLFMSACIIGIGAI